jgi:hypothetical protein
MIRQKTANNAGQTGLYYVSVPCANEQDDILVHVSYVADVGGNY